MIVRCGRSSPEWNLTDSMGVVRGVYERFRVAGRAEKPIDTATWLHWFHLCFIR